MELRLSTLSGAAWLLTSMILGGCSADPGPRQTVADSTPAPATTSDAPPTTSEPAMPLPEPSAREAAQVSSLAPRPAQIAVAYSPRDEVPPVEPGRVERATVEAATQKPTPRETTTPTGAPAKGALATKDPGGEVEIKATKAGLTRIGAVKCKVCHQVQFASWAKTAHATRKPPLDCEGCHGAGSEYKALAIMKDPKKARAAGMVDPTAAFCATCHPSGVTDEVMKRSHAHKAKS